ncbi:hypothetical protein GGR25_001913 [Kaistia hirudinis]|uniref:DUF1344 domain-containing protein n=1 Tax=Kaistia hirudinis TaxID=1293440 RepID=A0A840ANH7_9HYPH|nr:hypothetical protein [Kaistia hirudinis]MBB3930874.1 hypothetical protein [Kaistia hirudinis]
MKAIAILAPAALLMAAAPAFAVDFDSGRVTGMNQQTGQIALDNGHQYTVENPSQLIGVRPGEQVNVTFEGKKAIGFSEDPSQFDSSSGVPAQ